MEKQKKDKKNKVVYVKMCPKCKSINVHVGHQGAGSGLVAVGVPTMYRCIDCGFHNTWFPEVRIEIDNKKEKLKRKQK